MSSENKYEVIRQDPKP